MSKKVKSVSLYRYDILENGLADETTDWNEYIQNKTDYNTNDQIIKEITVGKYGEPDQVTEFLYDEHNKLISEEYFLGEEEASETVEYIYDAHDKIVQEIHQFGDGSTDITDYQYNEKGQLVSKTLTSDDGEIEKKEKFDYSGDWVIKEISEESLGNIVTENTYTYNDHGIVTESEQVVIQDGRRERLVNYFDDAGQRVKSLRYNHQDKLIEINRFNYQDNRLIEIEEETQRGNYFIRFSYDDQGNIISQEEVNDSGAVTSTIEREFDEEGRLIEAVMYVDGQNYRPNQHYIIKYVYEFFE